MFSILPKKVMNKVPKHIYQKSKGVSAAIQEVFMLMKLQKNWSSSYVSSAHFISLMMKRKVSSLFAVYMVCQPDKHLFDYSSKLVRELNNLPKIEGSK